MLNLLRMDLYRIIRSKSFYIIFGILLIAEAISFGTLFMVTHADTGTLSHIGITVSNVGDANAALTNLSLLDTFRQSMISGGGYAVLLGILSALFICIDFESGVIKNMMTAHENKWDYVLSKTISICIINFLYLAITYLAFILLNAVSGGPFKSSSVPDVLFFLLSAWMLVNGFSALTLLIGVLTRSKAAGVVLAVCVNSGLIVTLLSGVLGVFKLNWLMDNTIYMKLMALPSSFDGTYGLKPLLTGLIYVVVYTILSKIVLTIRDI